MAVSQKTASRIVLGIFPFLRWFQRYTWLEMQADFVAGLTVALVLIPQSMAYAQLADLPAYYGLYAAFLPPMIAAMFGSSNQLATGPVAIVSLMTSTALAPLATAGSESFVAYAILLAVIVGVFQFLLGVLRLGIVVNFLSHPVVNGFTNAAAIIIATSQLPKLFGVEVDKAEHHYETVYRTVLAAMHHTHGPTLLLGGLAFLVMVVLKRLNPRIPSVLCAVVLTTVISWAIGFEKNESVALDRIQSPEFAGLVGEYNTCIVELDHKMNMRVTVRAELQETERLFGQQSMEAIGVRAQQAILSVEVEELKERGSLLRGRLREFRFAQMGEGSTASLQPPAGLSAEQRRRGGSWHLKVSNRRLDEAALTMIGGGSVVGTIPRGVPKLTVPKFDLAVIRDLFPMAIIISLLGFMEAISIAKAMANQTGQRLDPNRELIGQGLGNVLGAFALSYPVSGSFSRSAVNIQAGAITGLSSVFSSVVVLVTLLLFTPLLYHLPQAVLAAIIMMAVIGLINIKGFVHAWTAQKYDGIISAISFFCTLAFAPHLDKGILIGVALSLALYLFRNMRPTTAVLSRTTDGHFRNADKLGLERCQHVAVIRFNGSLIFANVNYFESEVLQVVSTSPGLKQVLLVGNGINELDASGEVMLSFLVSKLKAAGITISFSGLNDQVIDVLKRTHLFEKIGSENFFADANQAVARIHAGRCLGDRTHECPLLRGTSGAENGADGLITG
ncbi:MAG: SulP family inorganic anion transporter [bacterium]